jgi:hypothetical protein
MSGVIAFLLTSDMKFALGGSYIYQTPSPTPSTTMCASMAVIKIDRFGHKNYRFFSPFMTSFQLVLDDTFSISL